MSKNYQVPDFPTLNFHSHQRGSIIFIGDTQRTLDSQIAMSSKIKIKKLEVFPLNHRYKNGKNIKKLQDRSDPVNNWINSHRSGISDPQ